MHVHVPKPLHGWKAFANEIVIIVIGVLIALGFEQVAEEVHWAHKVDDAHARLRLELSVHYLISAEAVAAAPCFTARYDALVARVRDSGDRLEPAPRVTPAASRAFIGDKGPAIAPIGRIMTPAVWDAIRADGTLLHMPPREQRWIAANYRLVDLINAIDPLALAVPDTLAEPVALDAASRINLIDRITIARRAYVLRMVRSAQLARAIRDIGMAPPDDQTQRAITSRYGAIMAACRAEGHPFADWRKAIDAQASLTQLGL